MADFSAPGPRVARADDDAQRARTYGLLASLLAAPPRAELLQRLQAIGNAQPDEHGHLPDAGLAGAWCSLKAAAAEAREPAVDDEYHALFIGIGRGELVPYGSWYLTGFLMERPLALLRQDLKVLGFGRQQGVYEPEDHVAALCDTMRMMIESRTIDIGRQHNFFDQHMAWMGRFFVDVQQAQSARFYRAVGRLGEQYMAFEREYLAMTI